MTGIELTTGDGGVQTITIHLDTGDAEELAGTGSASFTTTDGDDGGPTGMVVLDSDALNPSLDIEGDPDRPDRVTVTLTDDELFALDHTERAKFTSETGVETRVVIA